MGLNFLAPSHNKLIDYLDNLLRGNDFLSSRRGIMQLQLDANQVNAPIIYVEDLPQDHLRRYCSRM